MDRLTSVVEVATKVKEIFNADPSAVVLINDIGRVDWASERAEEVVTFLEGYFGVTFVKINTTDTYVTIAAGVAYSEIQS